jgi:TRAP-type mannitol/chloroaromatic compound transport system substrate-binding protein
LRSESAPAGRAPFGITWTVSLYGARRAHTEGIEGLAAHVPYKTDGNFEMSLQYGAVLSHPAENIDGLQLGAFEAAHICSFYRPGKTPVSTALNLPLLPLPTLEAQHQVYDELLRHPAIVA